MSGALKRIEAEALKLPRRSRAKLIEILLESIEVDEDPEVTAAWAEEAERRYDQLKAGKARVESAGSVFKRLRAGVR